MKIGETYFKEIDIDLLRDAPYNPPGRTSDEDIEWLAKSLADDGLWHNLVVIEPEGDATYEIVMGHRRKEAAKRAGIKKLRCEIRSSAYTQNERRLMNLEENVHREDLTYQQKSDMIAEIMRAYDDNTMIVAQKVHWPENRVVELLKYGALEPRLKAAIKSPDDFRNAVAASRLSEAKALELMQVARQQALNSRQVGSIAERMERDPKLKAKEAADKMKGRGTTVSITLDAAWNKALSDARQELDTSKQEYVETAVKQRLQKEGFAPYQEANATV